MACEVSGVLLRGISHGGLEGLVTTAQRCARKMQLCKTVAKLSARPWLAWACLLSKQEAVEKEALIYLVQSVHRPVLLIREES